MNLLAWGVAGKVKKKKNIIGLLNANLRASICQM
jgi:hypothetical protein